MAEHFDLLLDKESNLICFSFLMRSAATIACKVYLEFDIILFEGKHALLLSWSPKPSVSGYLQFKLSDYPVIK